MKTATRTFGYRPEEGQNPLTGFMSFQHFRGEKMYSDIVVRPEANRTETERVECYPPASDAEENGRNEGYYPDTSIVYIRILWKEFEPKRGVYNYEFIENILKEAREHSQTLIFRLMAHSTRAVDDVPEWLKELIPCPARPDGERVKDSPTDPLFLELFLEAVRRLGERFDSYPEFEAIDISLPGAWGEGYKLDMYPDDALETIMNTYTSVFKNTQLMTQLIRPNLIRYAKESAGLNVGWRGDGLGDPHHIYEFYPANIALISDNWKSAPVSFESYWWLGEWKRQGWNIDEIIEKTLRWHISSFNGKSMPAPEEWREKIDYWVSKMGYHFTVNYITAPTSISRDEKLTFDLGIENVGVAPIYKDARLMIKLSSPNYEVTFDAGCDVRSFLPGKWDVHVVCPADIALAPGKYSIEAKVFYEGIGDIYFATDAPRTNDGFYKLTEAEITD